MKILHIANTDAFLYHALRHKLLGLKDTGHEVHVSSPAGKHFAALEQMGFTMHPLPIARRISLLGDWRAYRACVCLLLRERFDLVHTHGAKAGFIGRAAAHRTHVARIVHTAPAGNDDTKLPWPLRMLQRRLERSAASWTHLLLAQSREAMEAFRNLAVPCRYEGSGVNLDDVCASLRSGGIRDTRRALHIAEDDIAVAFFARIEPAKGHLPFIEAFTHASHLDERLVCFFAGGSAYGGAYAARVAQALLDSPASNRMHLLGFREDIARLLRGMDILALPSHNEGLSRVIMEAMLLGLPVIGADTPGTRELVVHGETGLLVPYGDSAALARAMLTLSADAALRMRMGLAGYQRIKAHFDEKLVIERLTHAYASIRVNPR